MGSNLRNQGEYKQHYIHRGGEIFSWRDEREFKCMKTNWVDYP